ncbi:ATP-grasp domain-containing protein [Pasteurella multocida]|uniref:ATP-grasp domain-containing protein n=1 Tax=Pasteurella multocida TaxID=747 RepID=UPI00325FB574
MQKSALYPTVYVLGNGQLGRMLRYAGAPLDIDVQPLAFNTPRFDLATDSIITAEIERWEKTPLTEMLAHHANFVNQSVFAKLADRLSQKTLLDALQLPTSPWCLLKDKNQWSTVFDSIGEKVVVKRRMGGYDGRGQWIVQQQNTDAITDDLYGETIVEKFIPFDYEISLVGARFKNGETRFYPVTHNLQQKHYFNPARTLFIDDTENVLDSAKQFGIAYTVGVENPDSSLPDKRFKRHFSVNNYRTLVE